MDGPLQQSEAAGGKGAVLSGLRALLAEKFPQAPVREGHRFAVKTAGGEPVVALRQGAITEVSGSLGSGSLFLDALCHTAERERQMGALVDAVGALDLATAPLEGEGRNRALLWVWCQGVAQAIKVTDLLLRDGNLPLVMLDLQMAPHTELRRVPATTWYRFQRIMEQSSAVFVVLTPKPMISSAAERIVLRNRWRLSAMRQPRAALHLNVEWTQRGGVHGGRLHGVEERRIA